MTPEDRQIYIGLLYLREMETVLTDLVTYVNQQISLGALQVLNTSDVPEDTKKKFVVSRIALSGDMEGEILLAVSLNLALTYSTCMLGLSETALKDYIEKENYDADMQDATTEIFNLTTGAVERALRKHLEFSVSCAQKETKLFDLSQGEVPELAQGSCDWMVQEASIAEMEIEGHYFQVVPEKLSQEMTKAMGENLALEDAKKQFEESATLKIGETQEDRKDTKQPIRILIVEDTHMLRRLMATHLKEAGYTVLEKDEGVGAVRRAFLMAESLNLVITDMRLPNLDGFEVARLLKENEKTAHIPIIICSSRVEKKDIVRLKKLGVKNLLLIPFTREALIGKVVQIAGRP